MSTIQTTVCDQPYQQCCPVWNARVWRQCSWCCLFCYPGYGGFPRFAVWCKVILFDDCDFVTSYFSFHWSLRCFMLRNVSCSLLILPGVLFYAMCGGCWSCCSGWMLLLVVAVDLTPRSQRHTDVIRPCDLWHHRFTKEPQSLNFLQAHTIIGTQLNGRKH